MHAIYVTSFELDLLAVEVKNRPCQRRFTRSNTKQPSFSLLRANNRHSFVINKTCVAALIDKRKTNPHNSQCAPRHFPVSFVALVEHVLCVSV